MLETGVHCQHHLKSTGPSTVTAISVISHTISQAFILLSQLGIRVTCILFLPPCPLDPHRPPKATVIWTWSKEKLISTLTRKVLLIKNFAENTLFVY